VVHSTRIALSKADSNAKRPNASPLTCGDARLNDSTAREGRARARPRRRLVQRPVRPRRTCSQNQVHGRSKNTNLTNAIPSAKQKAPQNVKSASRMLPDGPTTPEQIHQRARAYWREDKAHSWNYAVGKHLTPQYQQADRTCHRAHHEGACRTAHSR